MKILSKKAIEDLITFVPIFKTSLESNYARNLGNRAMEALRDLFDRENGTTTKLDFGCPHCCLTFLKTLGKQYFESVEWYEREERESKVERMAKAREAKKNKKTN